MGSIDHLPKSRLNGHDGAANESYALDHALPARMDHDVLIIGGGFGGIYALHQLRQLGFRPHIVEAAPRLGGVWHWNRYPGARVDSEAPYYQLSIPEVWKNWTWSERFPGQEEIQRYFQHVDKVLGVSQDTTFNAAVVGADFDEDTGLWTITMNTGRKMTSRFLIAATGSSYKRHEPSFPGLESYAGELMHSASWPDKKVDFRGKRVAVIGAGATGVQCVQEIAKQPGAELTVYIRNPNIALPMVQREMLEVEQRTTKAAYPALFRAARVTALGLPGEPVTKITTEMTAEEREAHWEEHWNRGGFNFQAAGFADVMVDDEANRLMYDFWARKTAPRVRDPEKRAIVVPEERPYPFATKRSSLEQDYYECLDRDNVKIVCLKKTGIREFTPKGIVTEDGTEREHDIVVLATGYDSNTGSLTSMGLRGKDGVDMKERWKDGVWTYLGLMVRGCPNMFMIYGPQAPTAYTNAPPFIEQQVEFVAEMIAKARNENIKYVEPRQSAVQQWKETVTALNDATLFCKNESSWYQGGNIPGKPREPLNFAGGIPMYMKACWDSGEDWTKFEVVKADGRKDPVGGMDLDIQPVTVR
ncbi:cyclopentanone -monooxygenase [Colletotrichum plurivorum]|uniref:Cyclopentanone -monooxygenase n=1 Tax=Colletotrichum plurivorum TaxID=2175906 RepID=A0A8H6NK01_9PEZI|nr:cyclopentanone -monooxygenase [Colletotrichum plurivorum]